MLAAGAAMAVSGSIGASAAPVSAPATAVAPADNGLLQVKRHRHGGGGKHFRRYGGGGGKHYGRHRGRHRGHNGIWFGAPLLAAPFLYNGYGYDDGDYGYSSYSSGYSGGNSCYRACRYEHGPRYCRNNWEDYC